MVVTVERSLTGQISLPSARIIRRAALQRARRLPWIRELTVRSGDKVSPDDILGWQQVPARPVAVQVGLQLRCEPHEAPAYMIKQIGERVRANEPIAEKKGLLGLARKVCCSPVDGVVTYGPGASGEVLIAPDGRRKNLVSHLHGRVVTASEKEGCVIETTGGCVQGVAGLGVEVHGPLRVLAETRKDEISPTAIGPDCAGAVIAGGHIGREALTRAASQGVLGIVVGSITADLYWEAARMADCPTMVIIDGFGRMGMAEPAFQALVALKGEVAAVFPGTEVGHAGVPEVIVTVPWERGADHAEELGLELGAAVRILSGPYFGVIGIVVRAHSESIRLESGLVVPTLEVELSDGSRVTLPAANVELVG